MDSKLPKDMTIEIISRTSLRSFDAMRCTSKEMNKLTYDSNLMTRYKQRNHIVSGLITQTKRPTSSFSEVYVKQFVPSRESKSLDLGFLGEDDRIWACSEQGIMVLERPQLLFFVCKPATKQLIQLPHPETKYETEKVSIVVMDSKPPMRYKIVRFSRPPGGDEWESTYCCEIFDSSACETEWRLVDPIKLPYYSGFLDNQPIATRGYIYIMMTRGDVLKFDAYLEKWTSTLTIPKQTVYPLMKLLKYEGNLAYACKQQPKGYWEIWILTSDESWVKTYILNKNEDLKRLILAALYDSDTSIMLDFYKAMYHLFKTDDRGSNGPDESFATGFVYAISDTFVFRSDFDLIDHV